MDAGTQKVVRILLHFTKHLVPCLLTLGTLLVSCQSPNMPESTPEAPESNTGTPPVSEPGLTLNLTPTPQLETLSGTGDFGYREGAGNEAQFYHPSSIVRQDDGSLIVLDRLNYMLRLVDPMTGETSPYWGSGQRGNRDGNEAEGLMNDPFSLLAHSSGDLLITDSKNHTIRRLDSTGYLSTLAGTGSEGFKDGLGTTAAFNWPADIVEDAEGNLYVSDRFNHAIRKITPQGEVSTLAGNGEMGYDDAKGTQARFNEPMGLALGPDNVLYVADSQNHVIRKIILENGEVTTYAGSGFEGSREDVRTRAEFRVPTSLAFDPRGNLLVLDRFNHRLRRIANETVTTLMGTGFPERLDGATHESEGFSYPVDMTLDPEGNIYIVDHGNHAVRKITYFK